MKPLFLTIEFIFIINVLNQTNFIQNGGFELPALDPSVVNGKNATFWNGTFFDLKNDVTFNLGFGQYMDLQKAIYQNGYISQVIFLTQSGVYQLTYLQRARTTNYFYYKLQIYWNTQLMAIKSPNSTLVTTQVLQLYGIIGNNQLKFVEVGNNTDNHGTYIDQIKLILLIPDPLNNTQTNNQSSYNSSLQNSSNLNMKSLFLENQMYYIAFMLSLMFSHSTSIRYLFVLLEDLWLYSYDQRDYLGTVNEVFVTSTTIQELKFRVLERYLGWVKYSQYLSISDFKLFKTFEKTPQNLFITLFPYFIYNIPSKICMCILMFIVWKLFRNSCIKKYIKRYYFFWWNLFQSLIEGNLSYFAFLSFAHLCFAFNLRIWDKASLIFTIIFLFIMIIYGAIFYFIMQKFLRKNTNQFLSNVKRKISTYFFLQTTGIIKGIVKGTVFVFFAKLYFYQILVLSIGQIILILWILYAYLRSKIFKSKALFSLLFLYELTFLLMNIVLYFDYVAQMENQLMLREMLIQFQGFLVYTLIGISLLSMIIDLHPIKKKRKKQLQPPKQKQQDIRSSNNLEKNDLKNSRTIRVESLVPTTKKL